MHVKFAKQFTHYLILFQELESPSLRGTVPQSGIVSLCPSKMHNCPSFEWSEGVKNCAANHFERPF